MVQISEENGIVPPLRAIKCCVFCIASLAYSRGRERMAREPGVALLMIAYGSLR